jgi:1-pyrroline-5-carboxylate dehydrogenase
VNYADYVAWQSDQDAYAFSGQKCSAQSMLFMHENWTTPEVDIIAKLKANASTRNVEELTIGYE